MNEYTATEDPPVVDDELYDSPQPTEAQDGNSRPVDDDWDDD